jgi:membrane-bound serine protease (ClpP class)
LVLGAVLVLVEAHVSSLGVLGAPGVLALAGGAVLAVTGLGGGLILGVVSALALATVTLGVLALTLHKGVAVRRRRIRTGAEGLIGHVGVVRSWSESMGNVLVDGALWRARYSPFDDEGHQLHAGDPVVVEYLSGLTLSVRRAEDWELVR